MEIDTVDNARAGNIIDSQSLYILRLRVQQERTKGTWLWL